MRAGGASERSDRTSAGRLAPAQRHSGRRSRRPTNIAYAEHFNDLLQFGSRAFGISMVGTALAAFAVAALIRGEDAAQAETAGDERNSSRRFASPATHSTWKCQGKSVRSRKEYFHSAKQISTTDFGNSTRNVRRVLSLALFPLPTHIFAFITLKVQSYRIMFQVEKTTEISTIAAWKQKQYFRSLFVQTDCSKFGHRMTPFPALVFEIKSTILSHETSSTEPIGK